MFEMHAKLDKNWVGVGIQNQRQCTCPILFSHTLNRDIVILPELEILLSRLEIL